MEEAIIFKGTAGLTPILPTLVTRASKADVETPVSSNPPSKEPRDNREAEWGQKKEMHPDKLKHNEREEGDDKTPNPQRTVKHRKVETKEGLTKPKLIQKLRDGGKLKLIYDWINEFLQENGGTVDEGLESYFAIRVLNHVRKMWSTTQEDTDEPLLLAVAKYIAENLILEICNKRAKIFCCGLCDLDKCFSFVPLFHHMGSQHRTEEDWKNLMTVHEGELAVTWSFAPWPEYLPIRRKTITPQEGAEALKDHMRETVWKMNKFRVMPAAYRLALWFYLSLEWYIKYFGLTNPDSEIFTQSADYILEDTENSIFRVLQCNVCGSITNKKGNPWRWDDLRRHFEGAHASAEMGWTWMEKMIGLPAERMVPTFGEEISDENVKKEWLELWWRVEKRREMLVAVADAKASGSVTRVANRNSKSPHPSDTNLAPYSKNITWRSGLAESRKKRKDQGNTHIYLNDRKKRYNSIITGNEEIMLE